ncbi:MAG: hypothetical protein WCQ54_08520 [Clostridiaceae bacterium]
MSKKKKSNKHTKNNIEAFTEEQYEEYLKELYGMEFIAGFTEGGVPFGLFEEEETCAVKKSDNYDESEDELPF